MAVELFRSGEHRCIAFNDLVRGDDGVQANQFLIIDHGQAALIDPGGALLYTPVSMAVAQYVALRDLTYVLASHQDPDVIGSADRWLMYSGAEMVCSRLWGRFVPHSVPHYVDTGGSDRFILIPDEGMELPGFEGLPEGPDEDDDAFLDFSIPIQLAIPIEPPDSQIQPFLILTRNVSPTARGALGSPNGVSTITRSMSLRNE